MNKTLTAAAFLCLLSTGLRAQDIHFSQFYENAILRNPALTGIFSGDYKVGVNYRTQWGNISNPFQTTLVSGETRVQVNKEYHDYISFGACISYDHAGAIDFNSLQITPAINYNKRLFDAHASYLSVGFAASYIQRSVDPSKMTLDNQYVGGGYDPNAPTGETMKFDKITHYDVSAGVSFNSSMGENNQVIYYIGAAAYHVTRPKEAFNPNETLIRLSPKYTGSAGMTVRLAPEWALMATANYTSQAPYQEIIGGGMLSYRHALGAEQLFAIHAGCFIRLQDAVIPTIKIDYNSLAFTASYDVTTSSLKPSLSSEGGWEFSIFIRGRYPRKQDFMDRMECPRFEQELTSQFE
ncbi:MAG: PorP/SprF family type IX secretion system membrane protein [Bacteroidetes bacterium]|nr:PorP/SprF family type IX secretion system membrane protein [Bacteroidota bacterium]MBS1629065.1 PorP/SprF family type IX secretion system membrane protein [Bacteroidota bacterium]